MGVFVVIIVTLVLLSQNCITSFKINARREEPNDKIEIFPAKPLASDDRKNQSVLINQVQILSVKYAGNDSKLLNKVSNSVKYEYEINSVYNTVEDRDSELCTAGYIANNQTCEDCGLTFVTPNVDNTGTKIIGGITALSHSWPYHALIIQSFTGRYQFSDNSVYDITVRYQCAGTLISRYTILTAAHCKAKMFYYNYNGQDNYLDISPNNLYPTWQSMFKVYIGINQIYSANLTNPLAVSDIITHPNFDPTFLHNDIGLILLSDEVNLNSSIQPACLPSSVSTDFPDSVTKVAFAVGWGVIANNKTRTSTLNNVKLTVYDPSVCSTVAPGIPKDWNSQICAGDVNGAKAICFGDSGGGLYIKQNINNKQKYVVSGVVSYVDARGCAQPRIPNVFTRVSYYVDWIKQYWKAPSSFNVISNPSDETKTDTKKVICFSSDNYVTLSNNKKIPIMETKIGDKVKSIDTYGKIIDTTIVAILHKSTYEKTIFIKIKTDDNASIILSQKHLIYVKGNGYITADRVEIGDYLQNGNTTYSMVVSIDHAHRSTGYIAPLTENGVILVNSIHASCFAHVNNHTISLIFMKPLILLNQLFNYFQYKFTQNTDTEMHIYAKLLYYIANIFTPFMLE